MGISKSKSSLECMKDIVRTHDVIQNPFLTAFRKGELGERQIKLWLGQQVHLSLSLPHSFSAIHARLPPQEWELGRELVMLLKIEAWGDNDPGAHSKHLRELCDFFGLGIEELAKDDPRPYTREFIKLRLDICLSLDRPLEQGVAAIAIGNEWLNLYVFGAYKEGVNNNPTLRGCPEMYLDAHLEDEEKDFQFFDKVYSRIANSPQAEENARSGIIELLDGRNRFFDRLYEDLRPL